MDDQEQAIYDRLHEAVQPSVTYADPQRMAEALAAAPPEVLRQAAEVSRTQGNDAFRKGAFQDALRLYTQAVIGDPTDARNFANRAACWLALDQPMEALRESLEAVRRDAGFAKAHYRKGCALAALDAPGEAVRAFQEALKLDGGNSATQRALSEQMRKKRERDALKRLEAQAVAGAEVEQAKERGVSEAEAFRLAEEHVKEQEAAEAGEDVSVDLDLFRPRLTPARVVEAWREHPKGRPKKGDLVLGGLIKYIGEVSEVTAPRRLLRNTEHRPHEAEYLAGQAEAAVRGVGGTPVVLVLGGGCGAVPVAAARTGGRVVCVEPRRALARIVGAVAAANNADVRVVAKGIEQTTPEDMEEGKADVIVFSEPFYNMVPRRIVPAMRAALARFGHADTVVVPRRVRVAAVLLDAHTRRDALGMDLDLSELDGLRWAPGHAYIEAGALPTPRCVLSLPFTAAEFDLGSAAAPTSDLGLALSVPCVEAGACNAVCAWTEVDDEGGGDWLQPHRMYDLAYLAKEVEVACGDTVALAALHNTTRVWFGTRTQDAPAGALRFRRLGPPYLWDALADDERLEAYDAAVASAVAARGSGARVLSVGCGAGVVGMAAMRHGATRVTCCDGVQFLAEAARRMARRNGIKGLRVGPADIRTMTSRTQQQYDVVVLEGIDNGGLGEGLAHLAAHAKAELLAPGGAIVPRSVTISARLVEHTTPPVAGAAMAEWDRYRWQPEYTTLVAPPAGLRYLSPPVDVFHIDTMQPASMQAAVVPIVLRAAEAGVASAVAFALRVDTGGGVVDAWGEGGARRYWRPAVRYMAPVPVAEGEALRFLAKHDMADVSFVHVAKEGAATPQRGYDTAWLAQYRRVEDMGRTLNEGLAQDLREFSRAASAALTLATQPGWFALDPEDAGAMAMQFF